MPVATTEERTAKLEGLMEQMDKRLTSIESEMMYTNTRIDKMITDTNAGFEKVNTGIDQKFNWIMGIMITMWVTLIITMLFR